MNSEEILVIDDEIQMQKLLQITLQSNGYRVTIAANAGNGLASAARQLPDLILLDLVLPDQSGHTVLKALREWFSKPVIILSVRSQEEDIVRALDNGANDYLVKPFRTGELLARIRSSLRNAAREETSPLIKFKRVEIDLGARSVKIDNVLLKLTGTQYALLVLFVKNEGKVLTHQYILREVWGENYIHQSQYLRVFIAQLRKKMEEDPNRPRYLVTEQGIGYRFVASE
jgi:two-component system, OmpR family, KDP operon response regulator KdpE